MTSSYFCTYCNLFIPSTLWSEHPVEVKHRLMYRFLSTAEQKTNKQTNNPQKVNKGTKKETKPTNKQTQPKPTKHTGQP